MLEIHSLLFNVNFCNNCGHYPVSLLFRTYINLKLSKCNCSLKCHTDHKVKKSCIQIKISCNIKNLQYNILTWDSRKINCFQRKLPEVLYRAVHQSKKTFTLQNIVKVDASQIRH